MIEIPDCDYTYTKKDNDAALTRWTMHPYINDSIIGSFFSKELTPLTMDSWYSAFLKIEEVMYPVLFRGPICAKRMDYQMPPDWLQGTTYRMNMNVGPTIEDNEICISRPVLEAMMWEGHMPFFKMDNHGNPEYRSSLDRAQTCTREKGLDIEIIPYYFTNKLTDYFTDNLTNYFNNKKNWLNSKFKLTANPYHQNPYIESINDNATKGILLNDCIIGEQARTEKIDLSDEWKKYYNICYFLSFTSYGSINVLFDRQSVQHPTSKDGVVEDGKKKLQMETKPSIEDSLNDYHDWQITLGEKEPSEARIVIDNNGVSIDNIDSKKEEKKVEEDDELLLI